MAKSRSSTFGTVRKLPSGRWQALYYGTDGRRYSARHASGEPGTFDTKRDAQSALAAERTAVDGGTWLPPGVKPVGLPTLADYTADWISTRPLSVRTREGYEGLFRLYIADVLGGLQLGEITAERVRRWHAESTAKPTSKARAYGLLSAVMRTAEDDDLIPRNPCRIRNAGSVQPARPRKPTTPDELDRIVAHLPERYRVAALLAAWCSLRFGEVAGLQRQDVDLEAGVVRVRRSIVRTKAGRVAKGPKSSAGVRDVTVPPFLLPVLERHLERHTGPEGTAWLVPAPDGGTLPDTSLRKVWTAAVKAEGREDLTFHDLRHSGQTWSAALGASFRELMVRAGQSSPGAALRYVHAAEGAQKELAARLSAMRDS